MKSKLLVDIFRPECFSENPTESVDLFSIFGKKWYYASKGRYALYHILKNANITGRMLIPVYVCDTVLIPLKLLGIEPIFYDISLDDMNADVGSIEKLGKMFDVSAVLVVSMYGNPADYVKIEYICKKNNWFMIDDGAQAIGAQLNDRYVGTFGDAGFYSFSPGKPTAGPMGAFYWKSDLEVSGELRCHEWLHRLIYHEFYINRVKIYEDINIITRKALSIGVRLFYKIIDLKDDAMAPFEKSYLMDIFYKSLGKYKSIKAEWINKMSIKIKNEKFSVIKNCRGTSNSYKLILVARDSSTANDLIVYLKYNGIYASNGYEMLTDDFFYLPNAKKIDHCIVEVPIECYGRYNDFLIELLNAF